MTRASAAASRLVLALLLAGCSTLGSGPSQPDALPHGGTGPFRLLSREELDVAPTPPGSTLGESIGIESGMVAEAHLFYAGAPPLPEPDVDAGMPDDAAVADDAGTEADAGAGEADAGPPVGSSDGPDWARFEARRIYRSEPRDNGELGYDRGRVILEADEDWEGGLVHDPWAVALPDGRALLFYAAEGGVGLAEAPAIDGTFSRVGDGRVLALPGARRPSVVRGEGITGAPPLLLFVEDDGGIRSYGSTDDGRTWTERTRVVIPVLEPRDDRDSTEVEVGAPGVLAARTQAGRVMLRMYYESRRADGQVLLGMAGSFDGETWAQLGVPVFDGRASRMPAPRQLDSRITLLYMWTGNRGRGAVVAGIAPGGVRLPE